MIPLNSIFDIKYGNQLDANKMSFDDPKINFVNRSAKNLGVTDKVNFIKGIIPYKAGSITTALGGSILSSFVQQEDFYTGQNIKVLIPKQEMSFKEKVYYCLCIKFNQFKYNTFGREANSTFDTLLVPDRKDIPKWVYTSSIPKIPSTNPANLKHISLQDIDWKWFLLSDLFKIYKGERITKQNRVNGNIPLITATSRNNGVVEYIDFELFKHKKKVFKEKITIDMFFNTFYQKNEYFSDDNVHTLIPRKYQNKYIDLFITTILNFNKYKYAYGRQLRLIRLKGEKIKLPIDQQGNPDWQFMEDYIKSLPYSSNL